MHKHIWTSEKIEGNQWCNYIAHAHTINFSFHKNSSLKWLMVNKLRVRMLHWTQRKVLKQVLRYSVRKHSCFTNSVGHFTTNPQAHSYYDLCALLKMQIGCNCIWHIVNFDSAAHCIFYTVLFFFFLIEWLKFFMQLSCSRAIFLSFWIVCFCAEDMGMWDKEIMLLYPQEQLLN